MGAEVPSHNEPNRDPADFALTNKTMVCCHICRLIKSRNQVRAQGAERARWPPFACGDGGRGAPARPHSTPPTKPSRGCVAPTCAFPR